MFTKPLPGSSKLAMMHGETNHMSVGQNQDTFADLPGRPGQPGLDQNHIYKSRS